MQSVATPQLHGRRDLDTASLPSSILDLFLKFSPCFTRPSLDNFMALSIGWIVCIGRRCITRVIQAAPRTRGSKRRGKKRRKQGKHHSALYRFFSRAAWAPDALGRVLFEVLLTLVDELIVAIDDTLSEKSGPHVFGAGMHRDGTRSSYGRGAATGRQIAFSFGHCWVILSIWVPLPWFPSSQNRGIAVPILFRLYRPKKRCPENRYRKRTELARELLSIVADWAPADRPVHVVGDAEYACRTILPALKPNFTFTGPLPMDAALYDFPGNRPAKGRPPSKGQRIPSPKALIGDDSVPWKKIRVFIYGKKVSILVKAQRCLWYSVAKKRAVLVVVTRDPTGRLADRAFFSTNSKRSIEWLLTSFARRWELEVTIRNVKQELGLEEPQNGWWRRKQNTPAPPKRPGPNPHARRGELAVRRTAPLAFIAYALVVVWYLKRGAWKSDVARARRAAPWYRHKLTPSFTDMLAAFRRELWFSRLSEGADGKAPHANPRGALPHWLLAG